MNLNRNMDSKKCTQGGRKLGIGLIVALGIAVLGSNILVSCKGRHKNVEWALADTIAVEENEDEEVMIEPVELHMDGYQRATYNGWTYNFSGEGIARTNNATGERQKLDEYIETDNAWIIGDYLLVSGNVDYYGICLRVNLDNFKEVEYFGQGASLEGTTIVLNYLENVSDRTWTRYKIRVSCEDFVKLNATDINKMPHENEHQYEAVNHRGDETGKNEYEGEEG